MPLPLAPLSPKRRQQRLLARPKGSSLHVLLVEDDDVCVQLCKKFLVKYGCTVVVVKDGLAAISAVEKVKFDLVLMDIVMPNLDGASATAVIRSIKKALKKPRGLIASSTSVRNIRGNLSSALAAKRSPSGGATGRASQNLQAREPSQLLLKAGSFRKAITGKHNKNRDSISSAASTNTKHRSSIINIMSHGSNTSLQQLRFQQQQQQETSFDDKYVKDNTIFADYQLPCLKTNTGASEPEYHNTLRMKECPKIFPICEKDVDLGRMYSLYFEKDFVWAFLATGDLIRWRRPY